ncbi:MAG: hypothetical protein P4L81_02100 [Candidatus Pacebacteria bacterium]|nr:hypothetical protein [Candidatus Paceibacterota bacterium]
MEKIKPKSEAELIATVAKIQDAESCILFGQRALKAGMIALAAACEERAKALKPNKAIGVKKGLPKKEKTPMKTHVVSEQALMILIEDYKAGCAPTTYGDLAQRCGFEGGQNVRWFGQVTDLIDAACALANVPSFALVRVREANGNINEAAWRKEYSHLRDQVIATALAGVWTDEDFTKINDALAVFSAHAFGNKKAWNYVQGLINMESWAALAQH